MKEKSGFSINGWLLLAITLALGFAFLAGPLMRLITSNDETAIFYIVPSVVLGSFILRGFYTIEPNESIIQMFLGSYIGTDKKSGFRWTIPFFKRTRASLRIQDFETELIKVNDLNGNPIELSAIVIWRIQDTYSAYFDVEEFEKFIRKQSIAALRGLAMKYPYESFHADTQSLITHIEEVADQLKIDVQEKVDAAGLEIIEARINHLSYAREIASAMLQRQQASAIISAKTEIVEGAVGMVQMAINNLESKNIVTFDAEGKRKLVSDLLVVLCSDQGTQPIIQTGK